MIASQKAPRVIKRYQNRKLYDTSESCYVTLEDIAELIKQGDDVQILDNASKEDLTSATLAQIIFEEEKKQKHVLPLATFKNIIRSGGEALREFVQKSVESGVREWSTVRDEVADAIDRLVRRASLSADDRRSLLAMVRHFVESKIRPTVEHVQSIPTVQSEIRSLMSRIDELERRLKEHERR
ncbi:MAG: polyhydroxyalkanoate synthesis regulator DNA-binding domain-containing protein [Deltaproteobacteria bacterium]|nr:polyhydroxyalkanoate synthesis regulator DNA-binding domain-containing protein [Deltaproteobacteria bacterium]